MGGKVKRSFFAAVILLVGITFLANSAWADNILYYDSRKAAYEAYLKGLQWPTEPIISMEP